MLGRKKKMIPKKYVVVMIIILIILIIIFVCYFNNIVQNIIFRNPDKLIEFTRGIQEASAIDSNAIVEPSDMPGYDSQIIMASGSFTQGSSIELSCDGPVREPYIAYMQGGLTYQYGKIGVMKAVSKIIEE